MGGRNPTPLLTMPTGAGRRWQAWRAQRLWRAAWGVGSRTVAIVHEIGSGSIVLKFHDEGNAEAALGRGSAVVVSTALTLPASATIVDHPATTGMLAIRGACGFDSRVRLRV